ncbi:hypothetical protein FA95DRAFT_1605598 [Auriscalpium vulgare]|uniref:Uncharacterized protein n=1 Tax=Auriscalpium vulgare TaxID=40419 RepID=A0ACB8RW83_9AGAM|nr:hypothetical protein FA95DRAFT_1605598 [Auriscalpium vulgare]
MDDHHSRMYVDNVFHITGRWANRDPTRIVEVGDYGVIEHSSGTFQKEGNLYKDNLFDGPPEYTRSDPLDSYHRCSDTALVREVSVAGKGSSDAPAVGDAPFNAEFQFSDNKGGSALLMYKPILSAIPVKDVQILGTLPALKDKVIITETYLTPAYFMSLSTVASPVNVKVRLTEGGPNTEETTGRGSSGLKWEATGGSGFTQMGVTPNGEYGYVPLFRLMKRRVWSFKRDSPDPDYVKDIYWVDKPVPWRALDDDGIEFVDVVSSDEEDW